MDVIKQRCIEAYRIESENGDIFELIPGKVYDTAVPKTWKTNVTVFDKYWVSVPASCLEPVQNTPPRVKRIPIVLNHTSVAVMEIYRRPGTITDEFGFFWEETGNNPIINYKEVADEFIRQLEGEECINFIMALGNVCDEYVKEWEDRITAEAKE